MLSKWWALPIAVSALAHGVSAAAQTAGSLAEIEKAIAGRDHEESARQFDALVAARRPADGRPAPDPLLNGLYGRLLLDRGQGAIARGYLELADDDQVPDRQRVRALLTLAQLQLDEADRGAAAVTLAKLPAAPADRHDATTLVLLRASVRLLDAPAETIRLLQPLTDHWRADWLRAQAYQVAGDSASARIAADRAWLHAASAPAVDRAPLLVALLRAGLAAGADDRDGVKAMLSAANAWAFQLPSDLGGALPVCGTGGLVADDWATIAVAARGGSRVVFPTGASRPAAIAPFLQALALELQASSTDARNAAAGTIITVRCAVAPSETYPPLRDMDDFPRWMAQRGFYPSLRSDEDAIRDLAQELADLTEKFGRDNPIVIPQLIGLGGRLADRASFDVSVEPARIRNLQMQLRAMLKAAGATAAMMPTDEEVQNMQVITSGPPRDSVLPLVRATTRSMIDRVPFDHAAAATLNWLKEDKTLGQQERRDALEHLLARADAPSDGDPGLRAVLMNLAALERQAGNLAAARKLDRSAGLASDLCILQDEKPQLIEHSIESDDYPTDVLPYGIEGRTILELALDATGKIAGQRMLVSAPSGMFDATALREFDTVRLTAAVSRGAAAACRGYRQSIVWRLPDETDQPFISPMESAPLSTF